MRILLINNVHFRRGGADIVYLNTGQLLKEKGHEVFYFSTNHPENLPYSNSEHFALYLDYRKLTFLGKLKATIPFIYNRDAYTKLLEVLEEVKPDVVHIHLFLGGLTVSVLRALKKKNIPVVHTVHDYRLICPAYTLSDRENRICESCKDRFYLRCVFKRCSLEGKLSHSLMLSLEAYFRKYFFNPLDYIDRFIFVSCFSKEKHKEFNQSFGPKSVVIYNFSRISTPDKISKRGDYLLYYGRLSREKGLENLIEAVQQTGDLLKVVGTGPLSDKYKQLKANNIIFYGNKSGEELWEIVRNASFIVLPSEWYENNPLTIIESFSLGKPVIGAEIGGIPELVKTGNGFLFISKNNQSLCMALNNVRNIPDEIYKQISANVIEFSSCTFARESHYHQLMTIYNSAINDKKIIRHDKS